jgi:hypothetical protein
MAAEVHTEGLQFILAVAFPKSQSVPANFYAGLCTDTSLAEDATLASLTEVSGTGYGRQTVASSGSGFAEAATGTNDRKVTTATVTFTAGGTWTGAKTAFLATSSDGSGKLLASGPLSATRTLQNGDTLQVTFVIEADG